MGCAANVVMIRSAATAATRLAISPLASAAGGANFAVLLGKPAPALGSKLRAAFFQYALVPVRPVDAVELA